MSKILLFHHYNSSIGAGLSLLHILRFLPFPIEDITVCIPDIPGDLSQKIMDMGINVKKLSNIEAYMHFSGTHTSFLSRAHIKNCIRIKKNSSLIRQTIADESPDIVIVNSMTLFWIGRIAKDLGKQSVCFHRETYRHGLLGIRTCKMKRGLANDFDVVAFLSYYDINESYKGSAKYVRVTDKVDVEAYNSLCNMEEMRAKLKLPQHNKLVLYTGGMARLKGPGILVRALRKINDNRIKVVFLQYQPMCSDSILQKIKNFVKIALGKNYQYKIERYIQRYGLSDKILFRSATDKVEEYFVACDAVVFPCSDPHQARPIYEAGIAKKPIIITDFPNYHEFVDENSGWLFQYNDANALANCIKDALLAKDNKKIQVNYENTIKNNNITTMRDELCELFVILDKKRGMQ